MLLRAPIFVRCNTHLYDVRVLSKIAEKDYDLLGEYF